jgi:uncharacterized protein YdaU (DUF1376 family)
MAPDVERHEDPGPAFLFYPRDWLTGQGTTMMSPEQLGGFTNLLAHAWLSKPPCTLPNDDGALAKLSGLGPRWKKAGDLVRAQFVSGDGDRLYNRKLMAVYTELLEHRHRKSEAGRRGAGARWKRDANALRSQYEGHSSDDGNAMTDRWPSTSIAIAKKKEIARAENQPEVGGASTRSDRTRAFMERYPRLYAASRAGALYRIREARDFEAFEELVDREPNDDRLDALLELFLKVDAKNFLNNPGTPRQFLHMMPECDRLLRENGR